MLYQELQLNVSLERVNLVAGLTYFEEEGRSDAEASLSVIGTSNYFAQQAFGNAWSGLRSQNNTLTEPDAEQKQNHPAHQHTIRRVVSNVTRPPWR